MELLSKSTLNKNCSLTQSRFLRDTYRPRSKWPTVIFFGLKCLKLPNSSRKVVKLRSKNFQCIYLINTYEIFKKFLKILDLQIWDIRGFFAWKTFEIPQLMEKNSSDKSYHLRKILHLCLCIWGYDDGSQVSDDQFSKVRGFLETSE